MITFGKYASHWFRQTPRRMLYALSYYKFAAKLIGENKKILDIGCNEGLGTYLIGKECGYALGLDFDEEAISTAKKNFSSSVTSFDTKDILESNELGLWDAIINFDVIEHIYPENEDQFFRSMTSHLKQHGLVVIGTPSLISQEFASEVSKKGHVNIYSHERLQQTMEKYFSNVFLFSANDEMIHTGFLPLAHYFIAVGCKKK